MAIETLWYVMDGKLGVDLNNVITSVTQGVSPAQPEYPGPPANLGDRVQGNNGSEWMLVVASATISAFNYCRVGVGFAAENVPIVSSITATNSRYVYGFAQWQPRGGVTVGNANGGVANTGDFFWLLMKANGGMRINLDSSISANQGAKLYIDASTPGWLTTSATIANVFGLGPQVSVVGADNGVPAAMECCAFNYTFPGAIVSVPPVSTTA